MSQQPSTTPARGNPVSSTPTSSTLASAALVALLVGGAAGGAVGLLSGGSSSSGMPAHEGERGTPQPARGEAMVPDAIAARLAQMERRLDAWELQRTAAADEPPTAGAPQERTAAPAQPAAPPDWAERLVALEESVMVLSERIGGLGPMPTTLDGVLLALEDKNLKGTRLNAAQKERRRALHGWLLEHHPQHPQAQGALRQLVNDRLVTTGAADALEFLDEQAPRVGLQGWGLDRSRANLLGQSGRHDEARQIYWERENSPGVDADGKASAMFWRAYSFQREARYEEAKAIYLQLIARWDGTDAKGVEDSVGGAKSQLKQIAEWGH